MRIADQLRLTGPSVKGTSTESSHSLTFSSWLDGIVLMCTGARVKSVKTITMSKFLRPYCTRSRWATSISDRVRTRNGGSVRNTSVSVVGWRSTFARCGTPMKPSSRKGMSTSTCPSEASAFLSAKALKYLLRSARRLRSSCSCSSSSSSW